MEDIQSVIDRVFEKLLDLETLFVISLAIGFGYFYGYWFQRRRKKNEEEKNHKSFYIELPKELKIPIQQYLIFFKEYVEVAKNKIIDFEIVQTESGLKIKTNNTDDSNKVMKQWFEEYIHFIRANMNEIIIKVEGEVSSKEIDLLRIKLENQVANLNNSLKIAELENHYLKEDNQFLRNLTLAFSNKDNIIHTQIIQGGKQQFANKINNNDEN